MSQDALTANTPDTQIRWGIIGAGHIARTFATDIAYAPHATLAGVASRQLSRAQAFADDFSIPKAYGSYDDILADPNIDAIYIATPTPIISSSPLTPCVPENMCSAKNPPPLHLPNWKSDCRG